MSWAVEYCADSFAELKLIPDGEFDVVLTDSPFNEHVQKNIISGTAMKKFVNTGGGGSIPHKELPFAPLADYDFARDLVRVAKRWAINKCAIEDFGEFRRAVGPDWVKGSIWYKPNAQGQMTGDRPASCCEGLAIMHRKVGAKKAWNGRGSYGFWPCNSTRGEKDRHPNQMPFELVLKLVALFTNRDETVFDPFCGSGRIGEACVLLGRHYIGLDNATEWVQRARERLTIAAASPPVWTDVEALKLCTARKVDILEASEAA